MHEEQRDHKRRAAPYVVGLAGLLLVISAGAGVVALIAPHTGFGSTSPLVLTFFGIWFAATAVCWGVWGTSLLRRTVLALGCLICVAVVLKFEIDGLMWYAERNPPPRPMFRNHFGYHERALMPYWHRSFPISDSKGHLVWSDRQDNLLVLCVYGEKEGSYREPETDVEKAVFEVGHDFSIRTVTVDRTRNALIVILPDGTTNRFPLTRGIAQKIHSTWFSKSVPNLNSELANVLQPGTKENFNEFIYKFCEPKHPEIPATIKPVPDGLVVMTFDDSVKSHYTVARPILKKYGFGATFFITEGFTFKTNKKDYMTWDEIRALDQDGFEIGNHTRDHRGFGADNVDEVAEQLQGIDEACRRNGIPKPVSFAWPGNGFAVEVLPELKKHGIRFARRGGNPEFDQWSGRGYAYQPNRDHHLLIPSVAVPLPRWTLYDLVAAVTQARNGRIAVVQFHGVPEGEHPFVDTPRQVFEDFMLFLHDRNYKVIAVRDLARYVDVRQSPEDPMAIINARIKSSQQSKKPPETGKPSVKKGKTEAKTIKTLTKEK